MRKRLPVYLYSFRKESGLNQRELAELLGCGERGVVSRQERLQRIPSLTMAIMYSVILGKPISVLFAGLVEVAEVATEQRLRVLKASLIASLGTSSKKIMKQRKIDWVSGRLQALTNRRNPCA